MRAETAVPAAAVLGEGPTWDAAAGRLIWVDILASRVHTFDPATGRRTVLATEQHVGAAKPRGGGGLVVNLRDGIGLYDADGRFRWLRHQAVPGRRGNDAAVAPDGALWAGTMRYDEAPGGGTPGAVRAGRPGPHRAGRRHRLQRNRLESRRGGGCTTSTAPPGASTSSTSGRTGCPPAGARWRRSSRARATRTD